MQQICGRMCPAQMVTKHFLAYKNRKFTSKKTKDSDYCELTAMLNVE